MADWVRDKALMQIASSLGADALIPAWFAAGEQGRAASLSKSRPATRQQRSGG